MLVTVRFFTTLWEITKQRKQEVEMQDTSTLADLLTILSDKYGRRFKDYIYDETGQANPYLQFIINGKTISKSEHLTTRLKDRDEIAIIPPVGGG